MVLELPEPPSQSGGRKKHWRAKWAQVNSYKKAVWESALSQQIPSPSPPRRVRIDAHFRLFSRRDPLNLPGDLKVAVDALKQVPASRDRLAWKLIYPMRGYFVDDNQAELGTVTQEIDRKNRGLKLTITAI